MTHTPFEFSPGFRPHWPTRHVLFDFDGTLSFVRAGWAEVMTEMFMENLAGADRAVVVEGIMALNGKATIHQMEWLAARRREQGMRTAAATEYLDDFLHRLQMLIDDRLAGDREKLLVFGARALLEMLTARGLTLHIASGTDERAVRREAEALGIAHFFGGRIHGAKPDAMAFSKMGIIEAILRDYGCPGEALLSFGDGHIETANTKAVGGLAVAVASDEAQPGSGRIDAGKRERLLAAGADVVIADYRNAGALLETLLAP
ncbi:MAG: HAD family hydrolase [Chthoniobacteraceae bacterium]